MIAVSMLTGLVLIALGLGTFLLLPQRPPTALIPAALGALFLLLGFIGRDHRYRKHAMHAAAVLALIGIAGSYDGVIGLFAMLGGYEIASYYAVLAKSAMAGVCLAFLILAIRSFINARRSRPSEQP